MPFEVGGGPSSLPIVRGIVSSTATLSANQSTDFGAQDCFGYKRMVGYFYANVSAASRLIQQGMDGTNFRISEDVARDIAQSDFVYPFEVTINGPFCRIQFTNGATGQGTFEAVAWLSTI